MLSLKEIKERLEQATGSETWFKELENDTRIGAQKLINSWERKQQKLLLEKKAHEEKVLFDRSFCTNEQDLVAGVDEAGRGPLAGPVVTAAVILNAHAEELIGLNDSKQLSKEKRNELAIKIKNNAISYFIHFQTVEKIDELNIYEATKQSMTESVLHLHKRPSVVLVDAMKLPIDIETHSIIKGDAQSLAIAAASILAKTARDEYMDQLHERYPQYLFNKHAGYGTKEHVERIVKYGPIEHHRKTFEPIKSILKK
ncbi:ribonuclease HII [Psychrobacillus sp. OK032]|uniref:ribonuclease HII n=1 Tax=Psychrobacillus sp. OK032 TaxID=1884358 RepID=UPI0008B3DBEE|nr:ribonuclease HII [Psychrobacillus sp. OK032]SER54429.1 RNase HII [Psychrobacillus sp. OK032]